MGFNLGTALGGAIQGLVMTGNPIGAIAGGAAGGFAGGGAGGVISGLGGIDNGLTGLTAAGFLQGTQALNSQNMMFQLAMQAQSQQFDEMTSERSELLRETNTLRDVAMQQRKADNQIVKEFIRSIG